MLQNKLKYSIKKNEIQEQLKESPKEDDQLQKYQKSYSKNSQKKNASLRMPSIVLNRHYEHLDQPNTKHSQALSRTNDDSLSQSYVFDFSPNGSIIQIYQGRNDGNTRRCQSQIRRSNCSDPQELVLYNRQSLPLPSQTFEFEDGIIKVISDQQQFELPKITQNSNKLMKKIRKFKQIIRIIGRFITLYLKVLPKQSVKRTIVLQKHNQFQLKKMAMNFEKKIEEKVKFKFKQWTEPAFKKIFYYFQKHQNSLYEPSNINDDVLNDLKSIWSLNYAKFFFQNVELITRLGNIDQEIVKAMSDSLYRENNIMFSLFIAKRTNFYQGFISKKESQLLCCEFIFFEVIIPQLFELSNNLKFDSFEQTIKCKMNVVELASFVQIYFMKFFKDMPLRENVEFSNLYQRKLIISADKQQNLSLLITKDITLSETMIVGLKNEDYLKCLLEKREKWNTRLAALFKKTINNIYQQIEINH